MTKKKIKLKVDLNFILRIDQLSCKQTIQYNNNLL